MDQGGNKQRGKGERRSHDDRRTDGDRRLIDVGSPERRAGETDRRHVDKGPPERRLHKDRRDAEQGPPPGWKDRRRTPERRTPEVAEIPFEQWVRQRASYAPVADVPGTTDEPDDEAVPQKGTVVAK